MPYFRRSVICIMISFSTVSFGAGQQPAQGQSRQLSLADILIALRSKKAEIVEKNRILAEAVKDRGITFAMTPEIEKELTGTGAYRDLLDAIRTKTQALPAEMVAERKADIPKTDKTEPKPVQPVMDLSFYRNRATKELADGNIDPAISDLTKAIELKPDEAGTYLARALALLKQEKLDAAVKDLDKVIELDTKNGTAYFVRAQISEKLGQQDRARADFEKAAEIDPGNTEAVASAARLREIKLPPAKSVAPPGTIAEPPVTSRMVTVGALNNYAVKLELPKYTQIDRKMGHQGQVTVQIVLDEDGRVVSAVASDGPQTLRRVSEEAVRRSTFRPFNEGGRGVKAAGFIVYNFVANQ